MTGIFLKLLDMSRSASWIVLAVIAARLVLRKAPKWMSCALWALVAVRLLCPFSLESTLSLIPEIGLSEAVTSTAEASPGEILAVYSRNAEAVPEGETGRMTGYVVITDSDGNLLAVKDLKKTESNAELNLTRFFTTLWLVGIAVMAVYAAVSYLHIRKKVAVSIDLGNGVYICDYIDTPFILGIFTPKIYLSSAMDPVDAAHVLAHERAHLKRKDHWWKPLGFFLLAVHWFNPLLWVAYILLCRDIELACDERVVKDLAAPEKKAYSEALLKCSVPRHMIAACPLAFGEVGVKQRVKSVLHYKKPGFWVLLVSAMVILVVAVGFLTDPQRDTLRNILEIDTSRIESITVWSKTTRATYDTKAQITEFLDFLNSVAYDPNAVSDQPITETFDENNWSYNTIDIQYANYEAHILFNYDYSLVWTQDQDGNISLPCRVKDPELFAGYLRDNVMPIVRREASVGPFAQADQPVDWLHGICVEALQMAFLYTDSRYYLSEGPVSQLISVLNRISEDDLVSCRETDSFSRENVTGANAAIVLIDDANGLTAVLLYFDESLELVMVDSADCRFSAADDTPYPAVIWTVESRALRSLFTELILDPPATLAPVGSGFDLEEKLETLTNGQFRLSFHKLANWDYEFFHPENGDDFLGFRCRPKEEDEGWVTFGWWEDWPDSAVGEEVIQSNLYGYHYCYSHGNLPAGSLFDEDSSQPSSIRYNRAQCIHGDFLAHYQGTDSWAKRYQEDLSWIDFFLNISCEPEHTLTKMTEEVKSDLVNVAYYDWDSIARQLGAKQLTLFSPQYYEDWLFVGCQYEDGYRIACFRKIAGYDYEFVKLLTPVSKFLPRDRTQSTPVAEFETEDSPWYLYIIDDEAVTGVECNSGFWAYIPVDPCPALVVLDESLWGTDAESSVEFDLRYDASPQLFFHAGSNGSSFEFDTSPQYYLYDCLVNYNDGKDDLGAYSLDVQELWELSTLLLSLPELTENVFPENYEEPFDLTAADNGRPVIYMQLYLDETYSYLWSQDGIVQEDPGAVRLALYYCDGSITLGVNMKDLDNDFYRDVYYFKVESPELEDFILSKCDGSRKRVSLSAE